jgi:hypothetical protein
VHDVADRSGPLLAEVEKTETEEGNGRGKRNGTGHAQGRDVNLQRDARVCGEVVLSDAGV